MSSDVVIVGGGLGAVRTAQELRDLEHVGRVVVVSDESELPYDRPPLSKEYLTGKADDDAIRLVEAEELAKLDIELHLNKPARGLDRARRRVLLDDGELAYDTLVVATGAAPIALPALDGLENVMVLRSVHDSRRIGDALAGQIGRASCRERV